MIRIQLLSLAVSGVLLLFVVEMVRRQRLQERYSLLWVFGALLVLVLSAWPGLLDAVAPLLGISYPPAALFLGGLFLLVLLALHFSLAVSRLADQNRILAQRIARLELEAGEDFRDRTP